MLVDCTCSGRERGAADDGVAVTRAVHSVLVVFFSCHIVGLHFPPFFKLSVAI